MLSSWKTCCINIPQRWIFVFMAFQALWLCNALRVILSITIIEMAIPVKQEEIRQDDQTCQSFNNEPHRNSSHASGPIYDWDEYTQGVILSSYFWGYATTQFLMGTISERIGGKYVMGLGILIPAVLTFMTPACIEWGDSTALVVLRVIIGMSSGAIYPSSSSLLSHWSTSIERTRFGTFVYSGGSLGTVFGTTLPALIIKYLPGGWPSVYYCFGCMGLLWFPLWTILCYNCPKEHPFISDSELDHFYKNEHKQECKKSPPWTHILTSKQFWAFSIGLIGLDWIFYTMTNDLPKYISQVIGFSIEENGFLSALPYLAMWVATVLISWLADQILDRKVLSRTSLRKIFAAISLLGPAIFILGASYAGCDRFVVVMLLVTGMVLMSFSYPSLFVNPLDLSPNYSGTLMAIGNGLAAVAGIFAPYVVGILTPSQTIEEWRQVFYIVLGVALATSAYILLYTSAEVQKWDDPDFIRKKNKRTSVVGT